MLTPYVATVDRGSKDDRSPASHWFIRRAVASVYLNDAVFIIYVCNSLLIFLVSALVTASIMIRYAITERWV